MAQVTCGYLHFDGADDVVVVPDNAAYDVTDGVSFHVWLRRDWQDDGLPVLIHRTGTLTIRLNADGNVVVAVSGVRTVTSVASVPKQVWTALGVVIYESGANLVYEFYIGGALYERQTVEAAALPAGTNTAYNIGATGAGGSNFYKGRMTNLVSTSDRMTAAEIASVYALGKGIQDVDLFDNDMICFPFDDGSGVTVDNDGLAGVDGTINGSAVWALGPGLSLGDAPVLVADTVGDQLWGRLEIETIEWIKPTTAGHEMRVTDWNGKTLVNLKCAVAHDGGGQRLVSSVASIDGLKVATLGSGSVLVTLR